ncbi:MAG: hypothetical protein ACLFP2_02055 [Candidatus Woesearchaeota archaeon]
MRYIILLLLVSAAFACDFDTDCDVREKCIDGECNELSCAPDEAILPHECGKLVCGMGETAKNHECSLNPLVYVIGGVLGVLVVFLLFRNLYSEEVVIYQGSKKTVKRRWR